MFSLIAAQGADAPFVQAWGRAVSSKIVAESAHASKTAAEPMSPETKGG